VYKVVFTKPAHKSYEYLCKTNSAIADRIDRAIDALSEDPYQGKRLELNLKGINSLRVGQYRILYSIAHHIITITILEIAHRREAYR
jgi:mRNA interferase RelE/StbE